MTTADEAAGQVSERTVRRAVIASAMGNATEWFDYSVFTSGLVLTAISGGFFPGKESTGILASLALLAAGFITRPFGGLFWGPLGDKIGRKRVLSLTIILMSGCTTLVGCLPTSVGPYSAGIAAPLLLLLLRVIQGFSTGGEYGGAATFIAEYAPTRRRGFFGSFLEFGTLSGYVLGQVIVFAVAGIVGHDAMLSWGWRIPFFIALPLGLIGLYMRNKLEDTPEFKRLEKAGEKSEKAPLKETFVRNWRMIVNLMGLVFLLNIADYLLLTYMPTYLTAHLGVSDNASSWTIIGVELGQMAVILYFGKLSDRIGRKPLLMTAAIGFIVLSVPAFKLMEGKTTVGIVVGFAILALLLVLMLAVVGSTFPALFPTRVRYGSFAIGYNLSTSIFAGTAPLIVDALIEATGDNTIPAYYLIIAGLVALIPIFLIPETARVPIDKINEGGKIEGGQLDYLPSK
jgi:MHS family proline/betaine transporter-like MFS transporter